MSVEFGTRRGVAVDISQEVASGARPLNPEAEALRETFDLIYRSLCALLYNYVPMSGHPGGSISSGRFVASLLFGTLDYDVSDPDRPDADLISYAAGHKALGLYAMWALRDEVIRIGAPELLPGDVRQRLRLEDLLGFRRNPTTVTPLFRKKNVKPLDGHPTPATPFLRLSTGASGVGVPTSLGLAWGAMDAFGRAAAPRVHIVEGEGGLTPGRVAEALAAAGTASLGNAVLHIDWNQSSIDSDRVCRENGEPGEYVQWTPMELARLHDWNVIYVPDGFDFQHSVSSGRSTPASPPRSSTARRRDGSTASRAGSRTERGTSSVPPSSSRRCARSVSRATSSCRAVRTAS
jgi:transketolase